MKEKIFDTELYAKKAREVVAEGAVLLKNDNATLPLKKGTRVSLFGRSQFNYYKSGTGSGGSVNTSYVVDILKAFELQTDLKLNENLKESYEKWITDHPFDVGKGWAEEPWFQEEMPLDEELITKAKEESDVAIVFIGRTAGEDKDNKAEAGSYYLDSVEEEMLAKVCHAFDKTIVLLNVGNIIDMNWMEKYHPSAVMYIWQGGQEGGNGVLDLLRGKVSPSGKLPDTIAYRIEDYPSTANHGGESRNVYQEDIYVGYRYFETFARDRVMYPFGYGMSYTNFDFKVENIQITVPRGVDTQFEERSKYKNGLCCQVEVEVTNSGDYPGKEVLQLYCRKPQGALGQPAKVLVGFIKTRELKPGESERIELVSDIYSMLSYDDNGCTGHKNAYVFEAGSYEFFVGTDVRSATSVGCVGLASTVVYEEVEEAMAPVEDFERMKPARTSGNNVTGIYEVTYEIAYEPVPLGTVSPMVRRKERLPQELHYTGDRGYKLWDVADGTISMDEFVAQFSDYELTCLVRGEGMCSSKVTPGTASAFGGVTDELLAYGIPIACCADGPSGVRMDCGTEAFSLPIGTLLASTFNVPLIQELYEFEGLELRKNRVDFLLGPGINIHRNPLNGRNFEYFSEDPLLTGKMAVAQLESMHKYGVTGTIKHFAANSQEHNRHFVNAVVSERALREIYLKPFEIAVKEGNAYSIMTSYNPINGLWSASNYDLATTILREEWGYDGFVMTDWWAKCNDEGEDGNGQNTAAMVRSQNDVYMVVQDSASNSSKDNSMAAIEASSTTRGEYQRAAKNICNVLLRTPAFIHMQGIEDELDKKLKECLSEKDLAAADIKALPIEESVQVDVTEIDTRKGKVTLYQVLLKETVACEMEITCRAAANSDFAQIPMSIFQDKTLVKTIALNGTDREWQTFIVDLEKPGLPYFYLKFFFGLSGMEIQSIRIKVK